jgi:hypothetical protein
LLSVWAQTVFILKGNYGLGKAAACHGQVADFQPQILLQIKENVYKTLVNSDFFTIKKKLHLSFLAEKSCLDIATVSNLDSFHDGTTASIMIRQLPSPAKL